MQFSAVSASASKASKGRASGGGQEVVGFRRYNRHCVVNSNRSNRTNGINVVYYSTQDSPATEVDFSVNYGGHKYILDRKSVV